MPYRFGLRTAVFSFLIILLSSHLLAQHVQVDSLRTVLLTQKEGLARAGTLIALCDAYRTRNLLRSEGYGREAVTLARRAASPQMLARASVSLGWTLESLRRDTEARANFMSGATHAREEREYATLASALRGLGNIEHNVGNPDSALAFLEQALEISRRHDDNVGIAQALIDIGIVHRNRGKFDVALKLFQEGLQLSETADDKSGCAHAVIMIGDIARRQNRHTEAMQYLQRSRTLYRELDDSSGIATGLYLFGSIHMNQGQYDKALELFTQSLNSFTSIGDKSGMAITLTYIGHIHNVQGRFELALENYERGLELNEEMDNKMLMIGSLLSIGDVQLQQSRNEQALKSFQRGLQLCEEIDHKVLMASALIHIGRIHMGQGRYDQALNSYSRSRKVFDDLGDPGGASVAESFMADVYVAQGNLTQALTYYTFGLRHFEEGSDIQQLAHTLNSIGVIQMKQQKYTEALASYQRSLSIREGLDEKSGIAEVLTNIGIVHMKQGRYDSSIMLGTRAYTIARDVGAIGRLKDASKLLSDGYAFKGNFPRAYEFHKEYTVYKDSLLNKDKLESINEMIAKYESEKKEQKITLLEMDRELQRHAFTRQQEELLRQQLTTRQKQQMLDLMSKETVIQGLRLEKTNVELEKQRMENAQKKNEVALLTKDKELQSSLLERETLVRNASIAGILVLLIITALLFHRYRYKKRVSEQLTTTLEQLKVTQSQLIHAEKMVTLGEMTAGLAHEIKNPLNFVTNFSGLAHEMLEDLELAESEDARALLISDLRSNLSKIGEHGRRADSIIQGMMLHARGGVGELISTDINTLVEEAVNLAYHGVRATHISFNVTLVKNYHPSRLEMNVVQQEISRVLLNLLNNAMYAVRSATAVVPVQPLLGENDSPAAPLRPTDYEPTIWITTRKHRDNVEVRIRDNGPGIPDEIQQKIFQPFFTTKPTGEGTGLGLSMSYDIIVNGHGGSLTCSSSAEGAEFVISLPVRVE